MKNIFIKILLAISLVVSAQAGKISNLDLKEIKELPIIKNSGIRISKGKIIGEGWFYLVGTTYGKKVGIFTNKNKVIIGRGFNAQDAKEYKFDIDVAMYKKEAMYTIGNGPNEYFLFTDPECTYCKKLDSKLMNKTVLKNMKFYTYFFPLSFHLASNAMSVAIMNQSPEKRADYANKIMNLEMVKIVNEVDKYSSSLYKDIIKAFDNPRYSNLIMTYVKAININYKKTLKTKKEIIAFCNKQIKDLNNGELIENTIDKSVSIYSKDFDIKGTPTVYDMKGNKVKDIESLFASFDITNMEAIKEIVKQDMSIRYGEIGKEKLYIFTSTKCPFCIKMHKNKDFMKRIKDKYEVHFILIPIGNQASALGDIKKILSEKNMKKRLSSLESFFTDKKAVNLKISTSKKFNEKFNFYLNLQNETNINSTPTIVNKDGVVVRDHSKL